MLNHIRFPLMSRVPQKGVIKRHRAITAGNMGPNYKMGDDKSQTLSRDGHLTHCAKYI